MSDNYIGDIYHGDNYIGIQLGKIIEHELVAISEFLAFFLDYSVIFKAHDPHK
jgi:hypothetical protein